MPRYVKINSSDRLNPTTTLPGQFSIACDKPISGLNLKAIFIPITAYNVSVYNSKVYYFDSVARTATLTPGYYAASDLLAALAASMTAAGGGTYTCAVNSLTQLLTITSTVSFTMRFSNTTNSASEVLGFADVDGSSAALTQVGTAPISLATTLCFNISINNASGTTTLTTASTSFVIPAVVASVPSQLYYECPVNMPQWVDFEPSKYLNICIYDDRHRQLIFNSNWYMICEVMEPKCSDNSSY